MAGGLMQLVAYGAQDVYLTGNPQITLFKVVYRRHTNFSCECIELPIETAKPTGRVSVQVLRNGDLATKSYFRTTLPELVSTNNFSGKLAWVRRLGHAMIKSAEVQIGGSPIDKHYGVWLDIWYELTHTTDQERGYEAMIGDVDELTTLASSIADGYVLYVPLQFWFCRNYGLALPLIALQYHEVRINLEFERIENLVVHTAADGTTPKFGQLQFGSSGILVDYVYLDSEERRRFAQVGHEYLIEQVQYGESNLQGTSTTTSETTQTVQLNFNHPCKEIVWAHRLGVFNGTSESRFLGYTARRTEDAWKDELTEAAKRLVRSSLIALEGETSTETDTADLNELVFDPTNVSASQVFKLSNSVGTVLQFNRVVNVSDVEDAAPYAAYEATDSVGLVGTITVVLTALYGGGDSLLDKVSRATIDVHYSDNTDGANITDVKVVDVEHTLTLEDLSMPISKFTDNRVSGTTGDDVHVVQLNNYGTRLDGAGNIVTTGNLVLNGHDRFNPREGSYFNYVQPAQHHSRTPCDGINVYSFCLHAQQHQPTGTANMSRIDTARLIYKVVDPFAGSRPGSMVFDIYTGSIGYIFAPNYNVLRIMSGMGGLAYSN